MHEKLQCAIVRHTRTLVQDYNESLPLGFVAKAWVLVSPESDLHGLVPPRNYFKYIFGMFAHMQMNTCITLNECICPR